MVRPRLIVLSVFLAAALLAASSPAAGAARSPAKKAIWGPVTVNGKSEFPLYHDLGVGIFQFGIDWGSVAPTRPRHPRNPKDPAYQWDPEVDYAIHQAAIYHMRILLQPDHAPPWANGNRDRHYGPLLVSDQANFIAAAARRYPSVHLWMPWGEPNNRGQDRSLVPAPHGARRLTRAQAAAPRFYARVLDADYGVLKKASRRNIVIGGNTYTYGDISTKQWIRYMRLPNGKPPRMDLYGHNPFSWRAPNLHNPATQPKNRIAAWQVDFSDLRRLYKLVNKELGKPRHHNVRLFLSEWLIPTGPDSEVRFYTTRALQAQWITDGWRIVRHSPWIYALGWIHVYDDLPGGSLSGLLDVFGHPKPGYYAFKNG
jgi:hypothetical protein